MIPSNRDYLATRLSRTLFLVTLFALCIAVTSASQNETKTDDSTEMQVQNDSEENTDLENKEEPYNGVWDMMYDLWNWMIGGPSESKYAVGEPRTFGKIRRLQMALIPIVFKFGVISAMVTVLVFLALKTVFLLKMLLLLNAGAILAKILTHKADAYQHQPTWTGYNGWSTGPAVNPNGWPGASALNKEIHLHIHGGNQPQHGWEKSDSPAYSSSARYFDATNELNNPGPLPYLRQGYPNHHTYYTNVGR